MCSDLGRAPLERTPWTRHAVACAFAFAWAFALAGATACQRPDEPQPATSSAAVDPGGPAREKPRSSAPPPPASSAARCVRPTPEAPPPPVRAGADPRCPLDGAPRQPTHPLVAITFPDAASAPPTAPAPATVQAELVSAPADTERGLMYRKTMAEDRGMLFRLDRVVHSFWMHNTCIPLDMIFVDDDGLVVGIVENAPTLDDDPRTVDCPSRWVLEVNAGWSRRHGVRAGQRMIVPDSARSL